MIQPLKSLQNFKQNIEIEKTVGERYGYRLQNQSFQSKQFRLQQKRQNEKLSLNKQINPLHVIQKQVEPSKRYKQLLKEMQQQRIIRQRNQAAQRQQKPQLKIIELLNEKIKLYNQAIDHKHISRRKQARSIFEKQKGQQYLQKDSSAEMLEKLKHSQRELKKTGSLMSKFVKNKEINQIYRDFSFSIKFNEGRAAKKFQQQLSYNTPKKKTVTNFRTTAKIKSPEVQDFQIPRYQQSQYKNRQVDISYPYITKRFFEKSEDLNESVKRNRLLSSVIKQKVIHFTQKNKSSNQQTKLNTQKSKDRSFTELSKFSSEYNKASMVASQQQLNDSKKVQYKYLSTALQRRSPKFIKQEGSKFLIKFNSSKVAKQMIEGKKNKQEEKKQTPAYKRMATRKLKIPSNLTEEEKKIMELMIEEEDDAYYWTTCKNEKLNLLLKGKRHQ